MTAPVFVADDFIGQYGALRDKIGALRDDVAVLEAQAAKIRKLAIAQATQAVAAVMRESGVSADDLTPKTRQASGKPRAPWGSKSRAGQAQ